MKILLLLFAVIAFDFQVSSHQKVSATDTTRKTSQTRIKNKQNDNSSIFTWNEATFEKTQTLISVLQILATMLIALAVYRQANTLKKADYRQANALKKVEIQMQAIQAYNILNQTAVSSVENLITLDTMGRDTVYEPIELRRKRWCGFVWLEALQVTHNGLQKEMISEEYARQALDQQLKVILNDDFVFNLVCERGFDPEFIKYCEKIKKGLTTTSEVKTEVSKNETAS